MDIIIIESEKRTNLIQDAELAIENIIGSGLEPEILNFEEKKRKYLDMTNTELNRFVTDMHSVIFQSLTDEEQNEITELSETELESLDLTETEHFREYIMSSDTYVNEHVSSGQRIQNKLARKTNFALKRSIAIRSKRNRELCKGEWSTWSKKLNKCVYKDKSKTLKRKVALGIKPRRYKG